MVTSLLVAREFSKTFWITITSLRLPSSIASYFSRVSSSICRVEIASKAKGKSVVSSTFCFAIQEPAMMKMDISTLLIANQALSSSAFFLSSPLKYAPVGHSIVPKSSKLYTSPINDDNDIMSSEERSKFEEIYQKFLNDDGANAVGASTSDFPSAFPINPFRSTLKSGGGKAGLYSDEELFSVFNLHEELASEFDNEDTGNESVAPNVEDSLLGGIHDMVTKTLGQKKEISAFGLNSQLADIKMDPALKERSSQIRAIASDVDGTILSSKMTIHPRTRLAITNAIKSSSTGGRIQYFFPATGKSRKGALDSLGFEIGGLIEDNCAGVYLQGLFCVDTKGNVVFEKKLDSSAIAAAEALVEESGISIVGYDGDNLYTTDQTDIVIHLHEHYGEPLPQLLPKEDGGDIQKLAAHEPSMHKILILDDDTENLSNVVRPKLEALAEMYGACVTQALPTMLELLPKGCSKAMGVQKLCDALKIDPNTELLAIGDAENDAGMLDMACIGVAVANACPRARDASDFVVDLTNEQGGAGLAIDLFASD